MSDDEKRADIKKYESELKELETNILRQDETLKVMEEDYERVIEYMKIQDVDEETTEKLNKLEIMRKEKISALESLEEQVLQWRDSVGNISSALETVKKRIADNESQKTLLDEVFKYYRKVDEIEKQSDSVRKQLETDRKNYNNLLSRKEALMRQKALRKETWTKSYFLKRW